MSGCPAQSAAHRSYSSVPRGSEGVNRSKASLPRSVGNAVFVQLLMHGGGGLMERLFQKSLMIGLAVMVRDRAGPPLRGTAANILKAAVDQGQHVVRGLRAEQVILPAAGNVNRR